MRCSLKQYALPLFAAAALLAPRSAEAFVPYTPVPVPGPPVVGGGILLPTEVYGKEYSHDFDFSVVGPSPDPEQVIAWDGMGGSADTVDFSFSRPNWELDQEVDALANSRDALYRELRRDQAHLIFTHDNLVTGYGGPGGGFALQPIPSEGPVVLSNGNSIGGAGEVSLELAGAFGPSSTQFIWAKRPEVNAMPRPIDVDGLEVWGVEPREFVDVDVPVRGDSDKYSLDVDWLSGTSVWNAAGTPYMGWPTIVSAVESLLGPIPPSAFSPRDETQGRQSVNLDALMVLDVMGRPDIFDFDPIGNPNGEEIKDQNGQLIEMGDENKGDSLIFSIRQIIDPADADGYYATGSELFVLDALGGVSFLDHGGHLWDHSYALSELRAVSYEGQQTQYAVIDINGIEAIGEKVEAPPVFCPGDFNGDGMVDNGDLNLLLGNWGAAVPPAPAGWGGYQPTGPTVDNDELNVLLANWGMVCGPAPGMTGAAIPEPATLVLALLAVGPLAARRR
ncbi:hypothetical protein [Botrimarina hoheduenensis]|uniref:PEP-CTERM protein-sorting domain-containing protein n=1 Tax=Botrimarina hoheduenensis TaxID=2528000 RepID=A0A5C5VY52_9BACT|nr:hypothetical protein [Botrimarina hoheduenensis]TWT42863.1 hypothetical protein Pla111_25010 [Botrimarina hoheduenensis]